MHNVWTFGVEKNSNALFNSLAIHSELPFNSLQFTGRPTIVHFLESWYFGHMVDHCFRKPFFPHLFIKSKHKHTVHHDSEIYVSVKQSPALVTIECFLSIQNHMHSIFSLGKFYILTVWLVGWLVGWFDSLSSQHPLTINHKNYWHKHCVLCMRRTMHTQYIVYLGFLGFCLHLTYTMVCILKHVHIKMLK